MLTLLFALLIICLVGFCAFWVINQMGVPHPFNMILKVIVGIILLVALLEKSGMLHGTGLM